jgi:multidrug efflux system membrane fusion protein
MRSKRWIGVVAGVVVLAVVVWAVHAHTSKSAAAQQRAQSGQARTVPVAVATVARRDVPIYLEGLGNVTALKTVAVKSLVDGRLDSVLFKEGQAVKRGQVLAQIDPRPFQIQLEQAQGALARDEAQLKNAKLNVERDRQLVAEKLIAQQQLDTDVAAAGQLEGAVQIDRAAIDTAKLNLEYARITSPIDGITGIRQVDPGNIVHASDQNGIVIITQIDPIAVLFTLPQDQLTPVAEALSRANLPVDLYSRDGATLLGSGQLSLIDNQINQATSSIRLKATVPNPRRRLWPNQFVKTRLRLTTRRDALAIPAIALQRGPDGTFVYVVGSDQTAAVRKVEVELTEGDLAILARGVETGERVVVDGQNQLRPGAKVNPHDAGKSNGARVAEGAAAGGSGHTGGGEP